MKKILMLARDASPSGAFTRLEPVLRGRGIDVSLIVGNGEQLKQSRPEIAAAAISADIVLLGMSAPVANAELEMFAAGVAEENQRLFGFYGDVPKCWQYRTQEVGSKISGLGESVAFYFGLSQADAEAAMVVFPNARCFGTGSPLREESAFLSTRNEARAKLGIERGEIVILAPGGRFPGGLDTTGWTIIMEALKLLINNTGYKFRLFLTPHPGDRVAVAVDPANGAPLQIYEKLAELSPVPTRVVYKAEMRSSEILHGTDLVIEFGSSLGIEAAQIGIPGITLVFEPLLRYWEQVTGSQTVEQVENNISVLVQADSVILAEIVSGLLWNRSRFHRVFENQAKYYPRPTVPGQALGKMADAIETILAE